jgi:Domain of unknown function (DUF4267)
MKTHSIKSWGTGSVSYWLTFLVAAGILFIGIRFLVAPFIAADGYGIPLNHDAFPDYAYAKGIRDVYSGIILLVFLALRKARVTAILFSIATLIPASDFLIVLSRNSPGDITHLMIHGCTAIYMIVVSYLLFKEKSPV